MRICLFALLPVALQAQQSSELTTYHFDLQGRRTLAATQSSTRSNGVRLDTDAVPSLNGGTSARQSVEERVISEGPEGRVIERVVKRFDPSGNPIGTEKSRIEEIRKPDGTTMRTTTYDSNINGGFQVRERTTSDTAKAGDTTRTDTVVERPNVNGSLDLWEKRETLVAGDEKKDFRKDVMVYRRDANGSFRPNEREVTEVKASDDQVVTNAAKYNPDVSGKMDLTEQKVSRLTRGPGGSETTVVDIFGRIGPGVADGPAAKLREQQIIEKRTSPKGYVETFSVRRPELDGGKLGAVQKVSETVCSGKCTP
jgi:hypothetical protein